MNKIKTAIIGLGNMGRHHVRNYHEIPESDLVAVCDFDEELARDTGKKYEINYYTDLDEMFEKEEIQAVTLATPTKTHYELSKKIIEKGINILVEKPICDSLAKADEVIGAAKKKNVVLAVGHIERFNPAVLKLKELIDQGILGEITSVIARRVGGFPAQIKDANVIIDLAVHDIDIISYLLNKQPTEIDCHSGIALTEGREDHAELFLKYDNQSAYVQVNWITPIRIRNLCITGTKGYAELDYITQAIKLHKSKYAKDYDKHGDLIVRFQDPETIDVACQKSEPLKQELLNFLSACHGKETLLVSVDEARNSLDVALRSIKSAI